MKGYEWVTINADDAGEGICYSCDFYEDNGHAAAYCPNADCDDRNLYGVLRRVGPTLEEPWGQYKRKGLSEMRPYVLGEDLSTISVADVDDPPTDLGMVARNPENHRDQWYVAKKYFEDNLEEA